MTDVIVEVGNRVQGDMVVRCFAASVAASALLFFSGPVLAQGVLN